MKIFQPILALLLPLKAMACGLDWSPPVSHFENVDYQGNVHIVRKIGEVEKLPLYLIFNSTFGNSPYVGSGFELPFLEARMWQVDEGRFQAKMPTGWLWIFQRTKDPTVLEGNAGWKGVIKDDTITAWAPCGDKITFKTGRIASMKIKEDLYSYNYRDGRVASVEKNGRSVLEIKRDAMTGEVTGLALPGTWETIGLAVTAERPVVESIGGKNVVSRVEKTLSEVTPASGSDGKVTFEQTVNGELNPTIKLGDQLIAWNPATKKIVKDGEWTYDITPASSAFANAAIGRKNAKNESEFWHYDGGKGIEIVRKLDGTQTTTSWFTSGKMVGALRKRVETANGKERTIYQASFNENGNLFREVLENGDVNQIDYNASGQKIHKTRYVDGKPTYTVDYNEGRFSTVRSKDGRTLQYFYDSEGREEKMMINGKLHSQKVYSPDRTWEKETVFDDGSTTPSRTFYREFDDQGRISLDRFTEHTGNYPEVTKRYFYDKLGQLEKQIDSQQGTILYSIDETGRRVAKFAQ